MNSSPEEIERDLTFVGLLGMIDPPRAEVANALATAKKAGIRTVMITGDYAKTAKAIAERIGLLQPGHGVATGAELDQMSDADLAEEVMNTDVFARVSPEHKVRIVRALRANDQIVAMTGDGVNDAPALKQADIGVAMGITGTDVAKETADMVLTDDNYSSIVSAIEQGRIIYSNIRKFVYYLLSCNMAEILTIFLAIAVKLPSPLNPIQLVVAQPGDRRRPGAGPGHGKRRSRYHGPAAPPCHLSRSSTKPCALGSSCRRSPSRQ